MRLFLLTLGAAAVLGGNPADAAQPAPDHPLVGLWTYTWKDSACVERYRFGVDGRLTLSSGAAVISSRYEVAAKAGADGFYRMTETVLSDNLQLDCSGATVDLGRSQVSYVQFDPTRDLFLRCQSPSLASCFGPLVRQREP